MVHNLQVPVHCGCLQEEYSFQRTIHFRGPSKRLGVVPEDVSDINERTYSIKTYIPRLYALLLSGIEPFVGYHMQTNNIVSPRKAVGKA